MKAIKIGEHLFRMMEEKDVIIRGESARDQIECCLNCSMRLSYFNENRLSKHINQCRKQEKQVI
jgi:hypothetical protein